MTDPAEITSGRKIGTGLLTRTGSAYVGDVDWFGFPIGVRVTKEGDALRCEFFQRPRPDWATIPFVDDVVVP